MRDGSYHLEYNNDVVSNESYSISVRVEKKLLQLKKLEYHAPDGVRSRLRQLFKHSF